MSESGNIVEVGIAEIKIVRAPDTLVTRGLGSCLGIAMFDIQRKIGGLAHPMLPEIEKARAKSNPNKFVDYVIPAMIEGLKKEGCQQNDLAAKLFGGAHMFSSIPSNSSFNIGARNIEVAKECFNLHKIKIVAEDTGGNYGRTLVFTVATGKILVKTLFTGDKEL